MWAEASRLDSVLVLASVHLMGSVMGLGILLGKEKVQVSVKASAAAWADLSAVAWVNEARKRPYRLSPAPL